MGVTDTYRYKSMITESELTTLRGEVLLRKKKRDFGKRRKGHNGGIKISKNTVVWYNSSNETVKMAHTKKGRKQLSFTTDYNTRGFSGIKIC